LACKKVCPSDAIAGELKEIHVIDNVKCIKCGACFEACKFDAIKVE
jgi:Fe-S-cluster-containing hydrogenase component 2